MIILSLLPLLRVNIVTHHGVSQTLHFSEIFFLVVFGEDKKVSWIPESNIGICESAGTVLNSHVTTRLFSVIEYKKCTQTSGLCAKSHNCGIFIFIPDFTTVGGFADRYLLYVVCVSCVYRRKYPTPARVFYGGIVGCTVGQICDTHYE